MTFSVFALAAAAAAQAAAPQSGPKWVPLDSQQAKQEQGRGSPAPAPAVVPLLVGREAPLVIEQTQQQDSGNVLKQGTPIHLATDTEMSSHDNRVGDRVDLRVL